MIRVRDLRSDVKIIAGPNIAKNGTIIYGKYNAQKRHAGFKTKG